MTGNPRPAVGYRPGSWVGMAGRDMWLLADTDHGGVEARLCWELISARADEDEVLGALIRSGFRAVPSFGLVRLGPDGVHAVVRGGVRVDILDANGHTTHIAPEGSGDWADRTVGDPVIEIRLAMAADPGAALSALPLATGLVLASALSVDLSPVPPGTAAAHCDPYPEQPGTAEPVLATRPDRLEPGRSEPGDPEPDRSATTGPGFEPERSDANAAGRDAPASGDNTAADGPGRFAHLLGLSEPEQVAPPTTPITTVGPVFAPGDAPHSPMAPSALAAEPPTRDRPNPVAVQAEPAPAAAPTGMIMSFPTPFGASSRPHGTDGIRTDSAGPHGGHTGANLTAGSAEDEEDVWVTTIRRRSADSPAPPSGPTVTAVHCGAGHPNPPSAAACRVCGAAVTDRTPRDVPRPILGTLRLSDGYEIRLDRGVILGRAPDAAGTGPDVPNQVRLSGTDRDISRNHLEVRLDGWRVLVVDLASTNGTTISAPGRPVRQIEPMTEVEIEPGTVVGLSDITTFRFEVTG